MAKLIGVAARGADVETERGEVRRDDRDEAVLQSDATGAGERERVDHLATEDPGIGDRVRERERVGVVEPVGVAVLVSRDAVCVGDVANRGDAARVGCSPGDRRAGARPADLGPIGKELAGIGVQRREGHRDRLDDDVAFRCGNRHGDDEGHRNGRDRGESLHWARSFRSRRTGAARGWRGWQPEVVCPAIRSTLRDRSHGVLPRLFDPPFYARPQAPRARCLSRWVGVPPP